MATVLAVTVAGGLVGCTASDSETDAGGEESSGLEDAS